MQLCTFASSSRGNCALIRSGESAILVDAGISCRKIRQRLRKVGLTPDDLSGILITHEHTDHVSGLPVFLKNHPMPIYATPGTGFALTQKAPWFQDLLCTLPAGSAFNVGALGVESFSTSHDAADSVGYCISDEARTAVIATDLGRVTSIVLDAVCGADLAVIEANHDEDWLRTGPYPYTLQNRILGDRGHLSNEASAELAISLAAAGTETLLLAHLSPENNTPERAYTVVQNTLNRAHLHPKLFVPPKDDCSEVFTF